MTRSLDSAARARFADLLDRDPIPLDEAALALAAEEHPDRPPEPYLSRLDDLAERVQRLSPAAGRAASTLRALREVLHGEEGFRGNEDDYYDPRNSFLDDVLDRRVGIPITLSIVTMEVARRIGLRLDGVGFPGHFLCKYGTPPAEVFIDAFHGGEVLSRDECLARHRARAGGGDLDPRHLEPLGPRPILARVLGNLRRVSADRGEDVRLWWVLDRLLLLTPGRPDLLRDRGLCGARLGGSASARRDLEAYLERSPQAEDAPAIRAQVAALRGGRGPLAN